MANHPQNPPPVDPWARTRAARTNEQPGYNQPAQIPPPYGVPPAYPPVYRQRPPTRRLPGCCGCILWPLLALIGLFVLGMAYLLFPVRMDLLVMGIDRVPEGTALGRSDTMILMSVNPLRPDVRMLSIPRDLWVNIPNVGENRINTAHFFAEANMVGSGPQALLDTVNQNFDLDVPYYVRVRFDAFQGIVDAMGGVTVELSEPMGGLPPGIHHLNGEQALAFVRDRKGTDDFARMQQSLFMVRAVARELLTVPALPRWPAVMLAGLSSIDTNLPVWHWPRLGFALLRSVFAGIDSRSIGREMTTPFVTEGGADVLLPDWNQIHPLVDEMFR